MFLIISLLETESRLQHLCERFAESISIDTITDKKNPMTLLDGSSFQLQNNIFAHSHHQWLCIFTSDDCI